MKIFLDANILIAVINKEYPVFTEAGRIISLQRPRFQLYTTSVCLAIAFYYGSKKHGHIQAKKIIVALAPCLTICPCGSKEVENAISNKKVYDLEDGLEYYAALHQDCDCIVTEDRNDFYFSEIEILNCSNFSKKYLVR